jgi:hypothetical protein
LWIENRNAASGAAGLVGRSVNSSGVDGNSNTGPGLKGTSTSGLGVFANGGTGRGVEGQGDAYGGIFFFADRGVEAQGAEIGIFGIATDRNGRAGVFDGNVDVVGNLTKPSGSFLIDHPLDPENRYLLHSFVESPDMMNVYNGNVTLDANGEATVTLPDYFEALNIDYRYQLTPIGAPGPDLYIAEEVRDNQFKIAGGEPGSQVSWQVTGVRNDPYAQDNRIVVEQDKPEDERGTYLYDPDSAGGATLQGASSNASLIRGRPVPSTPSDIDAAEPVQP